MASEGMPVIVFFDEMDSIFCTRGFGVPRDTGEHRAAGNRAIIGVSPPEDA
jgi:ATP-dependent 26S proteasome regulatory subunit